jgi:hypothetical protein
MSSSSLISVLLRKVDISVNCQETHVQLTHLADYVRCKHSIECLALRLYAGREAWHRIYIHTMLLCMNDSSSRVKETHVLPTEVLNCRVATAAGVCIDMSSSNIYTRIDYAAFHVRSMFLCVG